jgi:tetratricopeptide (TPR) repeat protein
MADKEPRQKAPTGESEGRGIAHDAVAERETLEKAMRLFQEAYQRQMKGDLEDAIRLYKQSIGIRPTAEAHTFLGWTFSFQGNYDRAIEECKKAIAVDPDFGNPYNDIGAYLLDLGKLDEAIPWLETATRAVRYEAHHYPHCNLGRVYMAKGMLRKAIEEFERALEIEPDYVFARQALEALQQHLQ